MPVIVDRGGQCPDLESLLLKEGDAIGQRKAASRDVFAQQHFRTRGRNRQCRIPGDRARAALVTQKRDRCAHRMRNHQRKRRAAAQNADRQRELLRQQGGLQRLDPVIELFVRQG